MASDPHRWRVLAVVATAFFMTILDVSIVNVALPSIARALDFSQANLQWVITAYAISFGGFLLLGGRAADLLGRRRVFIVGVALFTVASFVCGVAQSEGMLIAARAIQGLGGAVISPAALSIVMTSFEEGPERNKALGVWGALGGSGAAVGVLAGGVLFANFFVLTLYVQDVLGYSAIKTGVTFVATAGTAVVAAGVAQALTTRFGPKPIIAMGLVLLTAAMVWYAHIPVHGSFASDLLTGYLLVGVGIAFAYVPVSIASLAGVVEREAGLASGLINTSQQVGGAIGTAIASTIFTSHFKSLRIEGKSLAEALTGGYAWAFWGLAVIGVLALIAALTLIRRQEMAEVPSAAPIG